MPHTTKTDMTAMDVYTWVKRIRRSFTTQDVATQFNIAKTRAAAFVAILRIKELVKQGAQSSGANTKTYVLA